MDAQQLQQILFFLSTNLIVFELAPGKGVVFQIVCLALRGAADVDTDDPHIFEPLFTVLLHHFQ